MTGAIGGALSGLSAIGGGISMVPLLVWRAGLDQRRAAATSLVAIVPISYNAPEHPAGAVALTTGIAGEAICTLRPDRLPPTQRRVLLAAAIDGTATFGDVGPIEQILRDEHGAPTARPTLDAATDQQRLILGTLYQRHGAWRRRAVGQGYPDDLADLAIRHGVDIDGEG